MNDIFNDELKESDKQALGNETVQKKINRYSERTGDQNETPMWQRYFDTDNTESINQSNRRTEEHFIEKEQGSLKEYLQSEEDYFVSSLFEGSEQRYYQTLDDISNQNYWYDAYELIEAHVFKSDSVDIYSEAAVDFTDRLQNYFLKKDNQT